tara:strand:+ start:5363 stop:6076 length:714 start_codon:yes stop_codon:yes gene_type:complete
MNLTIDIGNTYVKVAVFNSGEITKYQSFHNPNLEDLIFLTKGISITNSILCTVNELVDDLALIISHFKPIILTHKTKTPIKNSYKTMKTLGMDRLAGIVGAHSLFPNKDILLIDTGTCITYDYYINEKYIGGRISPGLKMRYDSLHSFTNKLPHVSLNSEYCNLGNDTVSSIISGVQVGVIDEMDAAIDLFKRENNKSIVILCGGDHNFFDKNLKNSIFAEPFIVNRGLNKIIEFNE